MGWHRGEYLPVRDRGLDCQRGKVPAEGGPWAAESSKVVNGSNEAGKKLLQSCAYLSDAVLAETKSGTGMTRPSFDHQLTYASMIATISSDRGSTITI
jgi:hypothetical protein